MLSVLTDKAKQIHEKKIGYRNEWYYGSGEKDAFSVIYYECTELGNVDVFETVQLLYPNVFNYTEDFLLSIQSEEVDDDLLKGEIIKIIDYTKERLGVVGNLEVIWVCASVKDIQGMYTASSPYELDKYQFDNFMILSDLDSEGVLVAYESYTIL